MPQPPAAASPISQGVRRFLRPIAAALAASGLLFAGACGGGGDSAAAPEEGAPARSPTSSAAR